MRNSRLKLPGDFVNFSRRKEFRNIRETEQENKRFFTRSITPIIRQFMFVHSIFPLNLFWSSNIPWTWLIIFDSLFVVNSKMNFWNKIYIYINSFVKYLSIKNFKYQTQNIKTSKYYFNFSHNFEPINFQLGDTPRFFHYHQAKNPPLHERKTAISDLDSQQIKLKSHSIRRLPDPREKSSVFINKTWWKDTQAGNVTW